MANENDIGGRVDLDITDFKANIAELNRQIKVIDSGFKAAAAGMDDWGKSEEGLQARIKALNDITDLQRKKVENLTTQYQQIVAEKGENSRAAQDLLIRINRETEALNRNEAEIRRSTQALENLRNESQEAADETDDLSNGVDDLNDRLKSMGEGAVKIAAAGIAAVGAAAAAAVAGIAKFANDSAKAMNNFQAQTGATAEEMAEFKEIASDVYTDNLGESMEDVAVAMAEVRRTTGETGESLKELTKDALMLRDTFGYEINETTRTSNTLMKQFGITGKQAMTLIAQGAQNGADKNGDLLDTLNEYSPQFKAMGYSAEQFLDILIQGANEGAWSIDKVGDAIKEFNIRAKDGSDSSAQAFQQLGLNADLMTQSFAAGGETAQAAFGKVISALEGIEDPVKRNQIGVALFGTQFEDLEAGAILALGNVRSQADMTSDTLQKINEVKYNDIDSALEGLKRNLITEIAEPVGTALLPKINELVASLKNVDTKPIVDGMMWIIDHAGALASGVAAVGTAFLGWKVGSLINTVITSIQALTTAQWGLNAAMAANPIGLIVAAIAAFAAGVAVLYNKWDEIMKLAAPLKIAILALLAPFTVVTAAIKAVVYAFQNWDSITGYVNGVLDGIKQWGANLAEWFTVEIPKMIDNVIGWFASLPERIVESFNSLLASIKQWGVDTVAWVTTEIPKIIEGIIQFFNELPNKIGYALGLALGTITKWGVDAWNWAKVEVPKLINSIGTFFAELPGKIGTAITSAFNNIKQWGINVGAWIATEIPKLINNIATFFAQIPTRISTALSTALQNVKDWALNLISTAQTEIPKVINSIIKFFDELPGRMVDIGKDVVNGLWNGIKNSAGWLRDQVLGFVDGVVEGFKSGFNSHSPSRRIRDEVGMTVGTGLGVGIEKSSKYALSAAMDTTNRITNGMKNGITDGAKNINMAMSGLNRELALNPTINPANVSKMNAMSNGGSGATQVTNNFSDMFRGANFVIRSDNDITKLGQEIGSYISNNTRGLGGAPA